VQRWAIIISIILLMAVLWGCSQTTQPKDQAATFKGTVYFLDENNLPVPLADALVQSTDYFAQTRSNTSGNYQLDIIFPEGTDEDQITLEASKAGFKTRQVVVLGKRGEITQVPDLVLEKLVSDSTPVVPDTASGDAAHIEVVEGHPSHIYVLGSGLTETAPIQFKVTDAQGRPVDARHRVRINFRILNGPGGGEYLEPDTMTTRDGMVYTVLNSGIIAGPVQLEAYAEVGGNIIRTQPVRIAIYGGLPDPAHFSIGIEKRNIAGRVHFGIIDKITAFVGDKYSNPVAPGTIVYFSTDYGIVEGAAVTDELGRATVRYMSAEPLPPNPQDSSFAHVTAWTFKDTVSENLISTRGKILLSDVTAPIIVSPASFQYDSLNNPVSFSYVVSDVWGNPLVAGTKIKVEATDGKLFGDVDIKLRESINPGPGTTQFGFTWVAEDTIKAPQVYITIVVDPPAIGNGYQSVQILGVKQ